MKIGNRADYILVDNSYFGEKSLRNKLNKFTKQITKRHVGVRNLLFNSVLDNIRMIKESTYENWK